LIKPDVFQAQHFYTNLYVSAAAFARGIRGVGAMRNDGTSEMRDLGWLMGRLSLHTPRLIAANSTAGIRNAMRWGVPESRLRMLRNVVDTEKFQPVARSIDGTVNILAIGRLSPQKRVDRFLRAIALIAPRARTPFKALIFGDGPERTKLESLACDLGLHDDLVEFKGRIADPREAYRQGHLLALTSDWEGTPNVVLEAMSSGLPVVATEAGDISDIVKNGETGFLASPDDEIGLAESIRLLIEDDEIRIKFGCRAREHIVANYSLRLLPRQLDSFYRVVFQ
jgi:glycosyltransferase involved in cell wall biosynthesis